MHTVVGVMPEGFAFPVNHRLERLCAGDPAAIDGVAAGAATAMALDAAAEGQPMGGQGIVLVPIVSLLMIGVGLLAALGPARRGLRINPTEALRAE